MKKISSENLNFLLIGIIGTLIICFLAFNVSHRFSNTSSSKDNYNNHDQVQDDIDESSTHKTPTPDISTPDNSLAPEVETPTVTPNPTIIPSPTPVITPTPSVIPPSSSRGSEEEVVSFFEQETNAVSTYNENDLTFREKAKNSFVTIVDFLFYGREIKGYTFSELTNSAKLKVISLALKLDSKIDEYFPNYKDWVKDKYVSFKGKIALLYLEVTQNLCEAVGDVTCNQAKEDFENMKNSFGFTWSLLKELGKSGKEKLSEFYLNWRNS